jgi:hypothetical protein
MKLCYGLLVSEKIDQIRNLINLLDVNDNEIVIHVDAKKDDIYFALKKEFSNNIHVHFIEDRINAYWAHISETEAAVRLFESVLNFVNDFDYFTILSESCLPLYPDEELKAFLETNKGKEFINARYEKLKRSRLHLYHDKQTTLQRKHRNYVAVSEIIIDFLFGNIIGRKEFSSWTVPYSTIWMTITKELLEYLVKTIHKENLLEKYNYTLMQDEHIFADVFMKSPFYKNQYKPNKKGKSLHYIDWKVINAPRVLTMKQYNKIYNPKTPCFFARKFDSSTDKEIIQKISNNCRNKDFKSKFN